MFCSDPTDLSPDSELFGKPFFRCKICKVMRPMDKIDVAVYPIKFDGKICGQHNVNYCNDDAQCENQAKNEKALKERGIL